MAEQARSYERGLPVPRLEAWRNRRALTQQELADKADVARSTVVRGETGGKIAAASVRKLAAALKVSVEDLMQTAER